MPPKNRYITRVVSTVQGGCDVELSPHTLIYGANAGGKDTIVRSLMLATRGAVDDLRGKDDVKAVQALAALVPGRQGRLEAHATDNLGNVARYVLDVDETGKTSNQGHIPIEGFTAPVVDLRAILDAGDKARRDWLMSIVSAGVTADLVALQIPGPVRMDYDTIAAMVRTTSPTIKPADLLLTVKAEAERQVREARAAAKAAKALVDRLATSAGSGVAVGGVTEAQIDAARLQHEGARTLLAQWTEEVGRLRAVEQAAHDKLAEGRRAGASGPSAYVGPPSDVTQDVIDRIAFAEQRCIDLDGQIAEATEQIRVLDEAIAQVPPQDPATGEWATETTRISEALRAVAQAQLAAIEDGRLSGCFLCGGPAQGAKDHAHKAIATAEESLAEVAAYRESHAEVTRWREWRDQWAATVNKATEHRQNWIDRWSRDTEHRAQVQAAYVAWEQAQRQTVRPVVDLAALEAAVADATEARQGAVAQQTVAQEVEAAAAQQLRTLEAALNAQDGIRRAQDDAVRAQEGEDRMKRLAGACAAASQAILNQQIDAFVEEVNRWMPAPENMPAAGRLGGGGRFGVRITETACEVGLDRNGVVYSVLSGAEEVIVHVALATAVAVRSGAQAAIVAPRERGIRPDVLASLMRALSDAPVQIVLTNTDKPKGRVRGWSLIDVGVTAVGVEAPTEEGSEAGESDEGSGDTGDVGSVEEVKARASATAPELAPALAPAHKPEAHKLQPPTGTGNALPRWAKEPGQCLTVLPVDVGHPADRVAALYPVAGGASDKHVVSSEDGGVLAVYYRFDGGLVARCEGGQLLVYSGTCQDPTGQTPPATPCWARPPELGKMMLAVAAGSEEALVKALGAAGVDADGARIVHRAPSTMGREWVRFRSGLVGWLSNDGGGSIYSGTRGGV